MLPLDIYPGSHKGMSVALCNRRRSACLIKSGRARMGKLTSTMLNSTMFRSAMLSNTMMMVL